MSTFNFPHIRKRSCRPYPESGAGTVEYVIVVLVAIVIGAGLLAFGNQVSGQVSKTGISISSWFSKANGTGGTGGGNAGGSSGSGGSTGNTTKTWPGTPDLRMVLVGGDSNMDKRVVFLVGRLPSDDEIECTVDYSLPFTPTGTDGETPGTVQLKKLNGSPSVFSGQSDNFHIGQAHYLADTQKPVKMVAHLSSTKYGSKDVEFSSGLPTLNDGLSDRTNFCYSDSVNGIVTGNPWNFD